MRNITRIIVHCSATPPSMDIGAEKIREWHLKRGWRDIGYHWVIRRNGVIENGRDLDGDGNITEEVGAHAFGYNQDSLGLCMVGGIDAKGYPDSNFTIAQFSALCRKLVNLKKQFPDAEIIGHREVSTKSCPSFDVESLIAGTTLARC